MAIIGCAPAFESLPGFVHTAFLPVGGPEAVVVEQIEHVLGAPKKVLASTFEDSPGSVEIRVYPFTAEYELALFFQDALFVALILPKRDSENYPTAFNKQTLLREAGDVRSYLLTRNGRAVFVKPVY